LEIPPDPGAELVELGSRRERRGGENQGEGSGREVAQNRAERQKGVLIQPLHIVDRDEYGPITGRPGGLFTAAVPVLLRDCDDLGRRLADWVPEDHLL